ncbi:hypothetical protein FHS96_004757 [Sphingomonas zeicaulis]|uniref:hypothetical protein n=1 Tax=Sphingomonas zeicaulis TaxID=1632740 RepID=UPI003D1AAA45
MAIVSGAALALPLPAPAAALSGETVAAIEHDSITVTGKRLGTTRIDYRLKDKAISYCGGRDREQDPAAIDRICGFVRDCAFDGQRAPVALRVCVEVRIARWQRRTGG